MSVESRRKKLQELTAMRLGVPAGAHLAIENDTPPADLRTWPWHAAVWDLPSAHAWPYSEHELETARAAWDAADQFVSSRRELAAERTEREAAGQRERDAERAATAKAELDALTDRLRKAYLAQPGATETGFTAALPAMLEQRARDAALNAHGDIPRVLPRRMLMQ